MRSSFIVSGLLLLLAVGTGQARQADGGDPVVVELFTSQGCSSCPPADRLLSRLDEIAGEVEILPLAFHVDYWNYLGWSDPFSAAEWSTRQGAYARSLGASRVYTPQLVVAGRRDFVGSDESAIREALAEAVRRRPAGRVWMAVEESEDGLEVALSARRLGALSGSPLEVMVAVAESGLVTQVGRGENARRELHNDFVVRKLLRACVLEEEVARDVVRIELEAGWRREGLRLVAFLQDPETLHIEGAASWSPTSS